MVTLFLICCTRITLNREGLSVSQHVVADNAPTNNVGIIALLSKYARSRVCTTSNFTPVKRNCGGSAYIFRDRPFPDVDTGDENEDNPNARHCYRFIFRYFTHSLAHNLERDIHSLGRVILLEFLFRATAIICQKFLVRIIVSRVLSECSERMIVMRRAPQIMHSTYSIMFIFPSEACFMAFSQVTKVTSPSTILVAAKPAILTGSLAAPN